MLEFSLSCFAEKLKIARKSHNLCQWQFGEILGIPRNLYAKYETGSCEPSYSFLFKISEFYRIPANAFLDPLVKPEEILNFVKK